MIDSECVVVDYTHVFIYIAVAWVYNYSIYMLYI